MALFPHRLTDEDSVCQHLHAAQVRINDIARLLLGISRSERTSVSLLLSRSGLPSLNRNSISATITELWKSLHSCDGPGGTCNPLGSFFSEPSQPHLNRVTRSQTAGDLPPPLLKKDSVFVWNAVKIFNDIPSLRSATSLTAVHKLAESYASATPL